MTGINRYEAFVASAYGGPYAAMRPSDSGSWVGFTEHEAEVARLRAEVEGLKKDAERYTWLKKEASRNKRGDAPGKLMVIISRNQLRADGDGFTGVSETPRGEDFDQSIDAAMKEQAE